MNTATIILFVLASAGATQIATRGRILNAIRPEGHFWRCGMCVGFWMGWVMAIIFMAAGLFQVCALWEYVLKCFVLACASSAASYILVSVVDDDGIRRSLTMTSKITIHSPEKKKRKR